MKIICNTKKTEYVKRAELLLSYNEKIQTSDDLILRITDDGISLEDDSLSLLEDFTTLLKRTSKQNLNSEPLVKAMKIKEDTHFSVLDATAGLGEDSFLLASAGFDVTLCEYNKVISTLLLDAINRGYKSGLDGTLCKMHLFEGDFRDYLKTLEEKLDIIYLDPMFPERQKSGSIKKKFQLLQKLEIPCQEGEELLFAAISADPKKIVIKRPAKGPYLGNKKPNYSLVGSTIRYDVLLLPRYFEKETKD